MKQIVFIFMALLLTASMAKAQDVAKAQTSNEPAAAIALDEEVYDFGDIKESAGPVTHIFVVKNNGEAPLVITRVLPTCGCTTPEWSKEPIAPNGKGSITVTYDPTGRPGPFNKTVNVLSNGKRGSVTIIIKGNVV
ncbi:MAG: DUF1573 domain-containing protein [Tannerellaceae bacterium]|jgi:hypothetical protein|nr:DUF1573 domain-containing protein [Tannerellaceae bacterium]